MANLRLVNLRALDSRVIKAKFTHSLNPLISTSNVTVESLTVSVPDAEVLKVAISNNVITIITKPLIPEAAYLITFKSVPGTIFKSVNGDAILFEDGQTNVRQIAGPEEPSNEIRDVLLSSLINNVYDLNRGTFVRFIINQISSNFLKARHDIRQAKNDNYLKVIVQDERKVRGRGPTDRLNEEGAFEILRVGKSATNTSLSTSFSYDSFPRDIITLLRTEVEDEELAAGNADQSGTFNGLVLTVSKAPITKVTRIFIEYQDGYEFNYNVETLGYQLNDSRYDEQFASTFVLLNDNQIGLSEAVLSESDFIRVPTTGDIVYVDYEYKSLGRIVDASSVTVTEIIDVVREAVPAVTNQFSLNFPIVTSAGAVATINGVVFLDPNSETPFLTTHPAFVNEVPFRANNIPAAPGEYSIDYETGRVFVYGASDKDGTGNYPPAATYKYLKTFRSGLDYTYDPDTNDLVANPERDLISLQASISFDYEQTLIPDVDYKPQVHQEVINERIDNRLRTTNSLYSENSPITNVFRIFNETTGEVYAPTRFSRNTIYFSANTPPRILEKKRERVSFENVVNESLLTKEELLNSSNIRIFKIQLLNNNIISITDDVIASSFSTSVSFSKTDIFTLERYFDGQVISLDSNLDRLSIGEYTVDYANGVIYLAVSNDQNYDLGTVNYKKSVINPKNPHIISVDEIYHSVNITLDPNKRLQYVSFSDGEITPSTFDLSDERFLNGDDSLQYVIDNDTITVSDDIKRIRHIFDVADLLNNLEPTDFGSAATSSGNVITLDDTGIEKQEMLVVSAGLTVDVSTISTGIEIGTVSSVVRVSDNAQLLDGSEVITGNTIQLSGGSGAIAGDVVIVIYTVVLNSAATPVVDYDRGDYFIDYTYLADEILISYEYGDNVLDFTESDTILEGDEYFVTYRFGALRDSLLPNFGSLIDIPAVQAFDIDLNRENYRNILLGALQTFTKGPTVPAIKQLVSTVTKVTPEIIESVFQIWSLGFSHLFRNNIDIHGEPEFVAGKFDQGLAIRNTGEAVSFPVSSNLRLEQGTLEMWVIPDWNGLDNDATITFSNLLKNSVSLTSSDIFIGASSYNPTLSEDGTFELNKSDEDSPIGLPSAIFTQTGLFIYYDTDNSLWKVLVKDSISGGDSVYTGKITSSGEVYNAKLMTDLADPSDSIKSGLNTISFILNIDGYDSASPDGYAEGDGYVSGYSFDGISFMADNQHYLFDFADEKDKNRFSLYKDGRGYLNFTVWDRGGKAPNKLTRRSRYDVSADIQAWEAGQQYHVAISWRLNTPDKRDEMHLFIDGEEVPNILRYGGRPTGTSSDRFRIVKPEIIAGTVPKNAIAGNDLITTQGSNTVISNSNDFTAQGIVPGDTIQISETGFSTYTITSVNVNILELSTTMPATLSDGRFSVNPYSVNVASQVDLYGNIAVSVLRGSDEIEIPGLRADIPGYSLSKDVFNENIVTILGNVLVGDQIAIRTLGLNHRRARETVYLWGDAQSILKTHMPPPINLDGVSITAVLLPITSIGLNNATVVGPNFVATGIQTSQPTNSTEGRQLEVRVTGGNVDFSSPTTITINGTTAGGPIFETLNFSSAGSQITVEKFLTITSVDVTTTPITTSSNGIAFEIKEAYPITTSNGNSTYPVIRFAFKTQLGTTLEGDGSSIVSDENGFFPVSDVDNLLLISSPPAVAGTYAITSKIDNNTVEINPAPGTAFSNGIYEIYSISIGRSGFQNGFFVLEQAGSTNISYPLPQGYYEFDYSAYLEVPFDPVNQTAYIGNSYTLAHPANAVIDELRISSLMLTDTRVGETLGVNEESVTTSHLAINKFVKNINTLMLLHFDDDTVENDTDYWRSANKEYIQSGSSVNDNFNQSILITDRGLSFDNKGTLVTRDQGSIEFWVSPRFDTYNDPVPRFYFDAASSVVEETVSLTKGTIKLTGRVSEVLSVRLQTDTQNIGSDFFSDGGGTIESDRQTISLKKPLPFQQTPVKVAYVPSGLGGDRLSIYKDSAGFIAFNVHAQNNDYQVRTPVFWERNTWHRIRATFKFNQQDNRDEIRLFIDGEERGVILFGTGILFGEGFIFGQTVAGVTNQILITDINFIDPINQYFIGSDYLGSNTAQARIDNFRISNISRTPISIGGQPFDVNFVSNTETAFPVIEDAFTTFLMDFEQLVEKIDDFAILRDEHFGVFNFTLNILDSFGILSDSERVRKVLESMILALKPANAKPEINYI